MDLFEPLQYEFFRNGLVVATVAGALCGLLGSYVVVRNLSYIGHGLSHAIFGGAAATAVAGLNLYVGAGLWGIASALVIGRVSRRRSIGSDAAIGVVTTASFALGLALFAAFGSARRSVDAVLFGTVVGVTPAATWAVLGVAVAVTALVFLQYRALLFCAFDPEVADVSGVRVARVDALFLVALAAAILATMKVVGVLLVAALLVVPAVVARMLTDRFGHMLWLSTGVGAACGFVGMFASWHLDIPSGAAIVLVGAAVFATVFAATGRRALSRVTVRG